MGVLLDIIAKGMSMVHLVAGGLGMLGWALVQQLLARGERVRVFDLRPHPDVRVESVVGDLRDPAQVAAAVIGVDTVFHCASAVNVQLGKPPTLYAVNVQGTQNLLMAAQQAGVKRLLYTSSQDVVFDGSPISGGDESLPYARQHLDFYGETKTLAEQIVLQANGVGGMLTCALRPCGIYGPRDQHRFPAIIREAAAGRMMRMGNPHSRFSHVYVENVAHAHLCAVDALAHHTAAGRAYFITDFPPQNFFDFFTPFLQAFGLDQPRRNIPQPLIDAVAHLLEWRWRLMPSDQTVRPLITRYVARSVGVDFWFSGERARAELGYAPIVDEATARERTLAWLRADVLPGLG